MPRFLFARKSICDSSSRLATNNPVSEIYTLYLLSSTFPFNGNSGNCKHSHTLISPASFNHSTHHIILRSSVLRDFRILKFFIFFSKLCWNWPVYTQNFRLIQPLCILYNIIFIIYQFVFFKMFRRINPADQLDNMFCWKPFLNNNFIRWLCNKVDLNYIFMSDFFFKITFSWANYIYFFTFLWGNLLFSRVYLDRFYQFFCCLIRQMLIFYQP